MIRTVALLSFQLMLKHLKMLNQTNILEKTLQNVLNTPTRKEGIFRLKSKKDIPMKHTILD